MNSDGHNLLEVRALIAALSDDFPEVQKQLQGLDRQGLIYLIGACGHVRDVAWMRLRELETR